jgi:hypothetical protein
MSNDKQQTAVEWFGMEMGKLFAQYHGKIICIGEFHKRRFELEQQAKEMEKRQIIKGMEIAFVDALQTQEGIESPYQDWEQYYEQTYGGGEQ